jgi:hypothetical protein
LGTEARWLAPDPVNSRDQALTRCSNHIPEQ